MRPCIVSLVGNVRKKFAVQNITTNNHYVKLGHMYCTLLYIDKTSALALVDVPREFVCRGKFEECLCLLSFLLKTF